MEALLNLDCEHRIVTWRDRPTGRVRKHTLRRVEKADLKEFFRRREKAPLLAPVELYRKLAVGAGGYVVKDADLMDLEKWRELVPDGDARLAVALLSSISAHHSADLPDIDPEFDVVRLNATWNPAADAKPGETHWHLGLSHSFARMMAEDEAELNDQLTRGLAVGGSRSGAVLRAIRELVLLAWYDRQIRMVEGYAVGGQPVASVEEIRQWMDPFHKIAAVEQWRAIVPDALVTPQPGEEREQE